VSREDVRYAHLGQWHKVGRADISPTPLLTPTSVLLAVSPASPAGSGSTETLTATMTPSGATGSIGFYNGPTLLATVALTAGVAVTTSVLASGSHSLTAKYIPTGLFAASTSPVVSYTVSGTAANTSTVLTVTPASPASTGVTETLTATLTPSGAVGSVQFYDGATAIGSPVAVSSGTAVLTQTLANGSRILGAVFTPTNSAIYTTSSAAGVSYRVGAATGSGSFVGLCLFGISDRSTTVGPDTHWDTDQTLSGGKFNTRRSYNTGACPTSWAGTTCALDVSKGIPSIWSFKPGTWSAAFLTPGAADSQNLLNTLKGCPPDHFLMFTANHEPDGGGSGYEDQPHADFGPMCRRIRPIVDQANAYRRGLNPNSIDIMFGPIMMEFSFRRTDTPFLGEAWLDHWWPGNGIFDFWGCDNYSNGVNPLRSVADIFDRPYNYARGGRVDTVTSEVHEALPFLCGEYGFFASTITETAKIQRINETVPYARAREIIAISYFNRGNSNATDPASYADGPFAPDWKLHVATGGNPGSLNVWGAIV